MRFLDYDVVEAARLHAMADYPHESCGAVTADGYLPLVNRAAHPEREFACGADIEPLIREGRLLALVHSHPDGHLPNGPGTGPSAHDITQQIAMAVPWGIVISARDAAMPPYYWGDQIEPPPLIGRDFRHGPSGTDGRGDCGALIRDYFRLERGIRIPDFGRDDRWWKAGEDHYRQHFEAAGFKRVSAGGASASPEPGDIALMEIESKVPNHAAIYLGDGLILHHLANRLSRTEPLIRWSRHITDWLRHDQA